MLKFALPFMAVAVLEIMSIGWPAPVRAANALAGSEWGIGGKEAPFVRFGADGRLTGHAGCNRFFGGYETAEDGSISIGPLASTRMACAADGLARETAFFAALEGARRFSRDGKLLLLKDGAGAVLAQLQQRDAD